MKPFFLRNGVRMIRTATMIVTAIEVENMIGIAA
jgi:hypothetical protein